jgi:hypothetical protein
MTAKRTPLNRHRKPLFDAETLALFVELEQTPMRRRKSRAFSDRTTNCIAGLGLGAARLCSQVSVLGRETAPYRPPGYPQHDDWMRTRGVRLALLEAAGLGSRGQARANQWCKSYARHLRCPLNVERVGLMGRGTKWILIMASGVIFSQAEEA